MNAFRTIPHGREFQLFAIKYIYKEGKFKAYIQYATNVIVDNGSVLKASLVT